MVNIIGVDLGGTNIKTALITSNGKIINKYETPTQVKKGAKTVCIIVKKSFQFYFFFNNIF